MKVLVVGTGGGFVSGISTAADQMVRSLEEMGHDVERVAAGTRPRARPSRLNLQNVTAVVGDAWKVARAARRFRADVVWYHTFGVPTLPALRALLVALAARLAGSRAVVHIHAFGLEGFVADGERPLRLVLRLLSRVTSAIVVLYDGARDVLRQIVPGEKVTVLPNWVEVPAEPTPLPAPPPFVLVFVGGIVERKGAPQLTDAMRLLADLPVELRLVGGHGEDGPDALKRLRASAKDLVEAGRVSFLGELSPGEVRAQLRAAHLFVLPSRAEGTPIAMLEAMAEGRPVLVGDAGNIRAVVETTGCGVVLDGLEPADIAAAVRSLVGDPVRLGTEANQAHVAARDGFSASAATGRIGEVLARLSRSSS